MQASPQADRLVDAIRELGEEIARLCPDCADKATRLLALVAELRPASIDRGAVRDAIETEVLDSGVSDAQVSTTTEAVLKTTRDPSG